MIHRIDDSGKKNWYSAFMLGDPVLYVGLVGGIVMLCFLLWLTFRSPPSKKSRAHDHATPDDQPKTRQCPLCGSWLTTGERVRSVVFPGKQEKLVHVFGCPFCYPQGKQAPRVCPVCKKELSADSFLVGILWEKPEKRHLHISGCTQCRRIS